MSSVTESIDVNVPVRAAYDQWTQFESFPEFMDNVQQVQQLDKTHLHWRASINGKDEEWDAVITEQVPDERIAWKSTTGAPNAGVVTFHRLGPDETKVTLQMDWQPEGVAEHVGDVLGFDSRSIKGDLDNFKQFIESRGTPTGAWRGDVNQSHTS
jgi:uncharacterized membrane protein